jgi:hypothetical protein
MNSQAWIILAVSGLISFFLGNWLRRVFNRRRFEQQQKAVAQLRALAAERESQEPPSHNKAKRRRQRQRSRSS